MWYSYLIDCSALNMQNTRKQNKNYAFLLQLLATASHFGIMNFGIFQWNTCWIHGKIVFGLLYELRSTDIAIFIYIYSEFTICTMQGMDDNNAMQYAIDSHTHLHSNSDITVVLHIYKSSNRDFVPLVFPIRR